MNAALYIEFTSNGWQTLLRGYYMVHQGAEYEH